MLFAFKAYTVIGVEVPTMANTAEKAWTPDVPTLVRDRISRFSGVSILDLPADATLTNDLAMKHPALVDLAESLRTIVKLFNKKGTIVVSDVENDDATVQSTVDLVQDRIKE